jgi:hypothetical protein
MARVWGGGDGEREAEACGGGGWERGGRRAGDLRRGSRFRDSFPFGSAFARPGVSGRKLIPAVTEVQLHDRYDRDPTDLIAPSLDSVEGWHFEPEIRTKPNSNNLNCRSIRVSRFRFDPDKFIIRSSDLRILILTTSCFKLFF